MSVICLLFNALNIIIFLKDVLSGRISPYIGTPVQTYVLCLSLTLNLVFLIMVLLSFRRGKGEFAFLKTLVAMQVLMLVVLLFIAPANYIILAVILTIFSWVFGAITLTSSNLDVEKVSDMGIYEVSEKK